jgi:hemolysin activation/secretion protein
MHCRAGPDRACRVVYCALFLASRLSCRSCRDRSDSRSTLHFLWLLLLAAPAFAASPLDLNALQHQNDIILRQQQEQLRQDQETIRHTPPPGGATLPAPAAATAEPGGPCRTIQSISINSAPHLPRKRQQALKQPYEGRCLQASDIQALLTAITGDYFQRGHVTTRAYLSAQDLSGGQLSITVVEGVIASLAVDGSRRDRTWLTGAFPGTLGKLLELRDLEQGIDQLNHQASNNARLDIEPGTNAGESIVVVHNSPTLPLHLLTSVDNQGSPSTGRRSAMATVSEDGRLGVNEVVSVTHRRTVPDNSNHFSSSNALDVWLPFGYNTLSFDVSSSSYITVLGTPSGVPLQSQGNTLSRSLGLDRVVYRDQTRRLSVSGTLNSQATDSYLANQFLDVSSRRLTYFDAGAALFTNLGSGLLNARLDLFRGLRTLGALKDPEGLDPDLPHAQFDKRTLSLGYERPFTVLKQPLHWSSQLNAQRGVTTLFGSQQMLIGSIGTVRGFQNNSLSGDSGYYWRNELSLAHHCQIGSVSMACRSYTAVDMGSVSSKASGVPSGALSGLTIGSSAQWRQLTGELFFSRALTMPAIVTREQGKAYFRLSCAL